MGYSELKPERQLDRPRAADLVQRIEAAALAAAAQCAVQRLRRLPEQRRGEVVYRAAEVGVVEDVEDIGAGLQRKPLAERELACSVKSTWEAPNPRWAFRPRSPCPDAGMLKAALLMIHPPPAFGSAT